MKLVLQSLNANLNPLIAWIKENKSTKVPEKYKIFLTNVLSHAVREIPLDEREMEHIAMFRNARLMKVKPLLDLCNISYHFGLWLKENPSFKLPNGEKLRLQNILKQVEELEVMTSDELSAFISAQSDHDYPDE